MIPQTAIAVRDLTKRFGDFTAVSGVSFAVQRGEIFGFLGPNGSGKTTTIRMMLGLLRPTSGSVEVLGSSVTRQGPEIRRRVGYMSQRFSLYNDLSVRQNLAFYGRAYGLGNEEMQDRIAQAVASAGLVGKEAVRTGDLAGGWRQRLALSAAILHRPEVLFLDEPTAGVDPLSRRAFWDLLYHLVEEGVTVFVTTHYMDEAEHCHRLALIQHGRLIASGSVLELRAAILPEPVLEIESLDPSRAVEILRREAQSGNLMLGRVDLYGDLIHIQAEEIHAQRKLVVAALKRAGLPPENATLIDPSLEDVFIACMHGGRQMEAHESEANYE